MLNSERCLTRLFHQRSHGNTSTYDADDTPIFETLREKIPAVFWSADFQIDSSLFNTLSVVRQSVSTHEDFLLQINRHVYFRINQNFTEFYKIVQKLNTFDQIARCMTSDIVSIRSQFNASKILVQSDIRSTQLRIKRRILLREVLKILETLKYIDKANSTIRTLFERTDFKKVSELLSILKNGFDNKLRKIKVFENKFEEINRLKQAFVNNLSKAAMSQLDSQYEVHLKDFKTYVQHFGSTAGEVLSLEVNESPLESVSSILVELRLFNETDLSGEASSNLTDAFFRFNRELITEVAKQLVFKKPSVSFLRSYKNLVRTLFLTFQFVFSSKREKESVSGVATSLAKGTTSFFKKVFDVFDLHTLTSDQMSQIIDLINSLGVVFNAEADSIFWQLQLSFKKLILNAKQLSFFQLLKTTMEEETWTAEDLTDDNESVIRCLLTGSNFELFTKYVKVDDTKYFLSRSFLMILTYFSDLIQFQENIGSVGTEFFTKVEEAVNLYLFNSENLLLNTGATQLKKITKINTKMLGFLTSFVRPPNPFPGRVSAKFGGQE